MWSALDSARQTGRSWLDCLAAKRVMCVDFRGVRWPHPCLTPLYSGDILHSEPILVYGKFMQEVYVGGMTDARKWQVGDHPDGEAGGSSTPSSRDFYSRGSD